MCFSRVNEPPFLGRKPAHVRFDSILATDSTLGCGQDLSPNPGVSLHPLARLSAQRQDAPHVATEYGNQRIVRQIRGEQTAEFPVHVVGHRSHQLASQGVVA